MTEPTGDALRVYMPGAFARLGRELADAFVATDVGRSQHVECAAFRPSGLLAQAILAGEHADVYVSANGAVDAAPAASRTGTALVDVGAQSFSPGRSTPCRCSRPRQSGSTWAHSVAPQPDTDPCGRYVEELWRREGMLRVMRAKQARGELVRSVGSGDLPAYLLDGRAQAGIFYLSEARQLDAPQVRTLELPPSQDLRERIRFVIGALTARGEPFMRFLLGRQGQVRLCAAGFLGGRSVQ